jgi:hypothetical protein
VSTAPPSSAAPPAANGGAGGRRREWQRDLVWAAAILQWLWLAAHSWYPRPAVDYPFLGGDGLAWLTDGLALGNERLPSGGRQPLLPIVFAVAAELGQTSAVPLLLLAAGAAFAPLAYALARRVAPPPVALVVAVSVLLADLLRLTSREVMADTTAALLVGFSLLAAPAASSQRLAAWGRSTGWAALAGLTQSAGLAIALVPAWLALGWSRRGLLRVIALSALAALPAVAWRGLQGVRGESPLVLQAQAALLVPWLDALPLYALLAVGALGWPWACAVAAGLCTLPTAWRGWWRGEPEASAREPRGGGRHGGGGRSGAEESAAVGARGGDVGGAEPALLVAAAVQALVAWGFFAVAYRWPSQRFLLYALPATVVLATAGLVWIARRPRYLVPVAAVLWLGAAWPRGNLSSSTLAVWPWPPRELVLDVRDGEPGVHLGWRRWRLGELPSRTVWVQTAAARRAFQPPVDRLPAAPAAVRSAVLLVDPALPVERRRKGQAALQVLLGVRTKTAPPDLFPASWWGWAHARRWARGDGFDAHLLRLGERSYLLVAPARLELAAPSPDRLPACARRALAAGDQLAGGARDPLVVFARPADGSFDGWLRPLLLASPSANTRVVPADDASLAAARPAPGIGVSPGLPLEAREVRHSGWDVRVWVPRPGAADPSCE